MFYFKKIVDFKNNAALKIRRTAAEGKRILQDTSGMTVVELLLILVGIFTPYYGVGIRCMA